MKFNIKEWQDKHLNEGTDSKKVISKHLQNIVNDWNKLSTTFDKALTQIESIAKSDSEVMSTYIYLQDAFERMGDGIATVHKIKQNK